MSGLIEGAVNGDKHQLRLLLEQLSNNISSLQQTAGQIGANTDSASPINPVPARAQLLVAKSTAGWLSAAITNPQFLRSTTPGQVRGNLARSTIVHRLSYSTDPSFKSGVTSLPPSAQTHYQIPTGGMPHYFRIESSVDGENYNQIQQSGPHTA